MPHAFAQHVYMGEMLLFEQRKETALQIARRQRQEVFAARLVRVALFFREQIRPPGNLQPLLVVGRQRELRHQACPPYQRVGFGVR